MYRSVTFGLVALSSWLNSSGCGAKNGEDWDYKIYFDPEADKRKGKSYDIKDEELMSKLPELVGVNERILQVSAYKVKLNSWQLSKFLLYHMFIVFETEDWWWSLEKHTDGLTIQRSKEYSAVKERYRQGKRNSGISLMDKDEGRMGVFELIEWLYKNDELNKPYDVRNSNCKHFATRVFNHVARTKTM